jgi:eukaryotic-like serine/threonine-protein kinase
MPLTPGTRLGPYEILTPLGAGGMGEVYKARDTRLDRIVAIKITKENFSERFEREARVIAALNHPNICQLYDVGPNYLVMEFIEGSPVAPVDSSRKLLDIAVQIADGLAAAHTAGIVHRDLKPDNILIARDGRIRILDFGLAKITADADNDKTALTDAGTTIGTIAYMSPEQARANADLTPQSDQFSFGLILYEIASGKRAFQRDSAAEIMTAIIREDAEPMAASVPAQFRWIVERLLAKEPADRYDSTRDLYRDLRQLRDRLSESTSISGVQPASTAAVPKRTQPFPKATAIVAGALVAIAAAAVAWIFHPASGVEHNRFTPMEVIWEDPSAAVWSPDGNAFAYAAGAAGDRRVFVRYLNSPTAKPLTRGAENWDPAGWSPDGKRVIVMGKNPQGDKPPEALFSVPVFGGEPDVIMPLDARSAAVSPDGKVLAAARNGDDGHIGVYTSSPVGSPLKHYTPAPFETKQFLNTPTLAFSQDGKSISLFVDIVGDKQAWRLPWPAGPPQRMMTSLHGYGGTPNFSWLPDGRNGILSFDTAQGEPNHLWLAGIRSGPRRQITAGTSYESWPVVSPDGKKILFSQVRAEYMLVSASLSDARAERVISSEEPTDMPAWASLQKSFVYESNRSGSPAIWMRSDGWDRPIVSEALFPPGTTSWFMTPALSPAGDRVVYTRADKDLQTADWISSVSGGPPIRLTDAKDLEFGGAWSPDGTRFAYWQLHNGGARLMVVKTSGEATPALLRDKISNGLPSWSPDGKWITFQDHSDEADNWSLISPDGKTVRKVGQPKAIQITFSADSKLLYGIRLDKDRQTLFSIDVATNAEKIIGDVGKDFTPESYVSPGVRLSLSPDGKSILYPALRSASSLWMLEGFDPPGLLDRLREMRPW